MKRREALVMCGLKRTNEMLWVKSFWFGRYGHIFLTKPLNQIFYFHFLYSYFLTSIYFPRLRGFCVWNGVKSGGNLFLYALGQFVGLLPKWSSQHIFFPLQVNYSLCACLDYPSYIVYVLMYGLCSICVSMSEITLEIRNNFFNLESVN